MGPALDELQTLLPGRVLLPAHEGWDLARLGWSVNVDQHPIAVVTVHTPATWSSPSGARPATA